MALGRDLDFELLSMGCLLARQSPERKPNSDVMFDMIVNTSVLVLHASMRQHAAQLRQLQGQLFMAHTLA
eukprot:682506-Amphidinium_carterae.1